MVHTECLGHRVKGCFSVDVTYCFTMSRSTNKENEIYVPCLLVSINIADRISGLERALFFSHCPSFFLHGEEERRRGGAATVGREERVVLPSKSDASDARRSYSYVNTGRAVIIRIWRIVQMRPSSPLVVRPVFFFPATFMHARLPFPYFSPARAILSDVAIHLRRDRWRVLRE